MQLAEKGSEFSFKIYFDDISEQQLQELIWSINLGENSETGNYCLKIGRGKPLGLGSVKIVIDKVFLRNLSLNGGCSRYRIEPMTERYIHNEKRPKGLDPEATSQFLRICDFHALESEKVPVRYPGIYTAPGVKPKNKNDIANHKWFTENKLVRSNEKADRKVQILPDIMGKQAMSAYELEYKEKH